MIYNATQALAVGVAAACPISSLSVKTASASGVSFTPTAAATQAQIAAAQNFIDGFAWKDYQPVPLHALIGSLTALTSTQKKNISTDLFSGNPLKVLLDSGPNAAAIFAVYYSTQTATLSSADKNLAELFAAAMYVQDNPFYLVNPSFDPTINVPGWQAV